MGIGERFTGNPYSGSFPSPNRSFNEGAALSFGDNGEVTKYATVDASSNDTNCFAFERFGKANYPNPSISLSTISSINISSV